MKIGKTRIEVIGDSLSGLEVAGIINPANDMLWMGGGISAGIRKAGGDSIEKEAVGKAPAEIIGYTSFDVAFSSSLDLDTETFHFDLHRIGGDWSI